MSLSFRNLKSRALSRAVSLAIAGLALGTSAAEAQDFYFTPDVSLAGEHHTNLELQIDPNAAKSTQGYIANAAGTFGWRGERGLTEIRPRLQFQQYREREDLSRTNQYLDLRNRYNTLKGLWEFVGRFDRRDDYNAESALAMYDDFDPNDPILLDLAGQVVVLSEQRTRMQLRPEYTHRFTERFGAGIAAVYQTVSFEREGNSTRIDYDYTQLEGGFKWGFGPLTELTTNVYAAQYQASDDSNTTDSLGAEFELEHRWTQTLRGTAALRFENTEVDNRGVVEKDSNWGFTIGVVGQSEVSQLRATLGRGFSPTGSGSRSQVDELRLQYDRDFTQRWRLISAVRAFHSEAQGTRVGRSNDRDYARGELELRWKMTPTWYVGAGYTYSWQQFDLGTDSQADNIFSLKVGYVGLPPQR